MGAIRALLTLYVSTKEDLHADLFLCTCLYRTLSVVIIFIHVTTLFKYILYLHYCFNFTPENILLCDLCLTLK